MTIPPRIESLVIATNRYRFVRLKALTTAAVGLMTPDNVNRAAGDLLTSIWKEPTTTPLLVDCSGIVSLSNYAFHGFASVRHKNPPSLVFFNITDNLTSDIETELNTIGGQYTYSKQSRSKSHHGTIAIFSPKDSRNFIVSTLIQQAEEADKIRIRTFLRETFHKNDSNTYEPLHSTPILATGIYNARHIICEPDQFNWTVLHLEQLLDQLVPDWDPSRHCLLSGSLRACPFAAALAFMKTPSRAVEILDHFGPHPALLEEHDLRPFKRGIEYVYVGDFMIGGTEIKIAANWAARRYCRIGSAAYLGMLWNAERYQMPDIQIKSLTFLDKLHPKAKYALNIR